MRIMAMPIRCLNRSNSDDAATSSTFSNVRRIETDRGLPIIVRVAGKDGDLVIATIYNVKDLAVYKLQDGSKVGYLNLPRGIVVYDILRLEGDNIVTTCADGHARVWNARKLQLISWVRISNHLLTAITKLDESHLIFGDLSGELTVRQFDRTKIGDCLTSVRLHGRDEPVLVQGSAMYRGIIDGQVYSLATNGDRILTGGKDGWAL